MIDRICPMCGIGVLEVSKVNGYECSNCREVFVRGRDMDWEVIPYEDWLAYVREKSIRENGTNNKNTGGKHNGR